jgi:hypothetical protein
MTAVQAKTCQWHRSSNRCINVATVTYHSPSLALPLELCDRHWDGIRKSLNDVFGDWERVARVEEYV